jgi:hypothetical protein
LDTIQVRTIFNGEISDPIDFPYDGEGQIEDIQNKIKEIFQKNVSHLIQVGRILVSEEIAKDAIAPVGYVFALLQN